MGRKGWLILAVCAVAVLLVAAIFYARSRHIMPTFGLAQPPITQAAVAPTAPPVVAAPVTRIVTYKVRRGDTLGAISRRYLGSAVKWRAIAKENGLPGSRIKPGMQLHITLVSVN
jgi:nucleoid-associated protein YgaU